MKDDRIIELLKVNDYAKASEMLYAYFPVIKKLVLKNNGTLQDAEDIYQEALMLLINKVRKGDFVLTSSLNTYLYSVCHFLWNDKLKKKNKSILTDFENAPEFFVEKETEDIKHSEREVKLAEKAFQLLGEKCRQLLLLFYIRKLSLKDISIALKFGSEKTAKNQKYRCLDKAKEHLKILKSASHE